MGQDEIVRELAVNQLTGFYSSIMFLLLKLQFSFKLYSIDIMYCIDSNSKL